MEARWNERNRELIVCRADGQPRCFAAPEVVEGGHEVFALEIRYGTGDDTLAVLSGPIGGATITRRHRYTASGKYLGLEVVAS